MKKAECFFIKKLIHALLGEEVKWIEKSDYKNSICFKTENHIIDIRSQSIATENWISKVVDQILKILPREDRMEREKMLPKLLRDLNKQYPTTALEEE